MSPDAPSTFRLPPEMLEALQAIKEHRFPACDEREILERLDAQVRAFGVLTNALATYVNDVPYSSGEMLSDMGALVRAQAQSSLRSVDEIAAPAQRMTANARARALKRR